MTSSRFAGSGGTPQPAVVGRARLTAAIIVVMITAACAGPQVTGPREYLDERTAATITVAGENMVFAYDRPELGVNARDYVTLTTVDVNSSGRHALHLVGFAWSTLDKRAIVESDSRYELIADDRALPLLPMTDGFRSIGINDPPIPVPSRRAVPLAAPITGDQLQFLRDTPGTRIVRTRDGVQERFDPWNAPQR